MSYLFKKNRNIFLILKYIFISLFLVLFYFGYDAYVGNKLIYTVFTLANFFLFFFIFRKKSFFYEIFFGILIFLGFWFKLSVTLSITPFTVGQFSEGVGLFDHSPNSFDEVLIISFCGFLGFFIAGYVRQYFFSYPQKIIFKNKNKIYEKFRVHLWLLFLLLSIIIFILNISFGIYQKGLLSSYEGNVIFINFLKWFLLLGLTSLSSWLIYNEIKTKKMSYFSYFISIFEIFLSSLSMISRGMIFNSGSIYFGIYKFSKKVNLNFGIKKFLIFLFFIFALFYISVISVNHIRANFFYIGQSFIEKKKLNENKTQKVINTTKSINISKQNSELVYLAINRWVGIDAVMAINAKKEILGYDLIKKAFQEEFNRYEPSFYEKNFNLKNNIYETININSKGNTLTGIIGFSYYMGDKFIVFLSLFVLSLFASLIEYFSFKMTNKNLIFSSLIGQIIAFRFIHFGYLPHQTYLLFSAIFLSILMIYILNKLVDILNKKYL